MSIDQGSSFVWQVKANISELPPLNMIFTFSYACLTEGSSEPRQAKHQFKLANFQVRAINEYSSLDKMPTLENLSWLFS